MIHIIFNLFLIKIQFLNLKLMKAQVKKGALAYAMVGGGKGAFIGEGAKLARTVVGDGTYVGAGLDLSDKIVIGNRIFDAIANDWTEVEEPGIAHKMGLSKSSWLSRLWRFLQGSSKGRRG